MNDFTSNIQRGIVWLNYNIPGWETRIDLDRLNIGSSQDCVLAQATGMCYDDATYQYDIEFTQAVEMGFATYPGDKTREQIHEELSILNQQWYFQIYRLKQVTSCKK